MPHKTQQVEWGFKYKTMSKRKYKKRKPHSEETKRKIKESHLKIRHLARDRYKGEKSYQWTGDNATYWAIHQWLLGNFKKVGICQNSICKFKNPKRTEWSLLKGKKMERKRENFWELCPSCHRKYDYKDELRKLMARLVKERRRKPVLQMSLNGTIIKKWYSMTEASNVIGVNLSCISQVCSGKAGRKTAGGFKWQLNNKIKQIKQKYD